MSCCFSVPFLAECVTSLCSFRCQCVPNAPVTPTADMEMMTDPVGFLFIYEVMQQ